jgi:hypothetical protein
LIIQAPFLLFGFGGIGGESNTVSAFNRGSKFGDAFALIDPDLNDFGGLGGAINSSCVCTNITELDADEGFRLRVKDLGGRGGIVASDGS